MVRDADPHPTSPSKPCSLSIVPEIIWFSQPKGMFSSQESPLKPDHVYLRHLSTEYRSILSADMSTDSRPICRPTVGRYIDRYSADMSAETRSIYRPTVGRHACRATPSDTSPPLGRHSTDTLPTLSQHYAHLVSSCY